MSDSCPLALIPCTALPRPGPAEGARHRLGRRDATASGERQSGAELLLAAGDDPARRVAGGGQGGRCGADPGHGGGAGPERRRGDGEAHARPEPAAAAPEPGSDALLRQVEQRHARADRARCEARAAARRRPAPRARKGRPVRRPEQWAPDGVLAAAPGRYLAFDDEYEGAADRVACAVSGCSAPRTKRRARTRRRPSPRRTSWTT